MEQRQIGASESISSSMLWGVCRRLDTDYVDLLLLHLHDNKTAHEDTIAGC